MFKGGLTLVHHVVQSILIRYCHKSSSATIKFIRKDGREKLRSLSHSLQFAKSFLKKSMKFYFKRITHRCGFFEKNPHSANKNILFWQIVCIKLSFFEIFIFISRFIVYSNLRSKLR